uniref:Uncharacterized protein n=1 Tax=Candidatus Kentrum sp. TC TaxID=2126339 RepID=A0A450YLX0_9GAMM|nr:MAG: hypothetical protein BECKTC1821E_GA0114239_101938 [Candidatus Kentron sp. TC]
MVKPRNREGEALLAHTLSDNHNLTERIQEVEKTSTGVDVKRMPFYKLCAKHGMQNNGVLGRDIFRGSEMGASMLRLASPDARSASSPSPPILSIGKTERVTFLRIVLISRFFRMFS